ncbi:MAG: chaperone NapD [Selenomonas sp.]|uniref:chaperone NapD n=1 Tax=Selenomonas sp. TaxID=2053611 RepID=UPI0025FEC832|nr:chaperone NapD [Selenomonas sp.]MCR5756902.1 chaperone NapD [Selenomonas sp.]
MAIAGVVLKYQAGQEKAVREGLQAFSQASIETKAPSGDLVLAVEAEDIDKLHATCSAMAKIPGVLGVYPSYVTTEDEI